MPDLTLPAKLARLPRAGALPVPWVSLWSAELGTAFLVEEYQLGEKALAVSHREAIGKGSALLGQMSQVRQRRCLLRKLCQVCGEPMTRRYAALHTDCNTVVVDGRLLPVLIEPPACATCASFALTYCPGVRGRTFVEVLEIPFLIRQMVRPVGDVELDGMFAPLRPQDFPPTGAVGYIKYPVGKWRPAEIAPLAVSPPPK